MRTIRTSKAPAETLTPDGVREALRSVEDPELPVSIVDLGIVHEVQVTPDRVQVVLMPTFVGCPALDVIRDRVRERLEEIAGGRTIELEYKFRPAWGPERIAGTARKSLRQTGVSLPMLDDPGGPDTDAAWTRVDCPYCGSTNVVMDSPFGPTLCRASYYCQDCKHPFERMKRL